ncbi:MULTISPECIES: hypothetical protein [Klebsiella pneumoniae complex]|uniref:hypothetical protein n=1 Tax=Klebsiella pneumoniae complex TaxID=3390273 RepID=UPI000808CCD3|nr:hypothetical protein [Klebsiella pneumoniae]SCA15739.1 Uncharacterised protein [Klebsiella pneumoniae]HBQ2124601.1 hypothetical protein [Klebsiella pneumoniae]HBS6296595.1 hypothetical protein [Klebsiella pneumoniae]HBX8373936.1 hypothetical protein [Klebsiella pneumoniae]HBZ7855974.1 hypothetical protein [Klebsiella pneumoniae]
MTVFWTIVSGVMVYVIGQISMKMLIEPVSEQRKVISKITYDLRFYADKLANPKDRANAEMMEICTLMRQHSSQLHSATNLIPLYSFWHYVFGLPHPNKIKDATENLIRLSHGFRDGPLENQDVLNAYAMQKVNQALGVSIPAAEFLDPEKERLFIKAKKPW